LRYSCLRRTKASANAPIDAHACPGIFRSPPRRSPTALHEHPAFVDPGASRTVPASSSPKKPPSREEADPEELVPVPPADDRLPLVAVTLPDGVPEDPEGAPCPVELPPELALDVPSPEEELPDPVPPDDARPEEPPASVPLVAPASAPLVAPAPPSEAHAAVFPVDLITSQLLAPLELASACAW
jgi:hypothetical protein